MGEAWQSQFAWTDEAVARLRRLWTDEQRSAGHIANSFGCSRSAITGKVNRLGINRCRAAKPGSRKIKAPKVKPMPRNPVGNFRKPPKPVPSAAMKFGVGGNGVRPKPAIPVIERIEPAGKKTLLQLLHHDCRFGIGDPQSDGFRFCAEAVKPGSVYCPAHHARCYSPSPPRRPSTEPRTSRRAA
jgi:GcrA cell cycle regulator